MENILINVLIVEDSRTQADFLTYLLNSDPNIRVVGIAHNGEDAIVSAIELKPDVITMDLSLPKMNGFDATRKIMETMPVPIVIVSASYDDRSVEDTFHAIEAGALAIVAKPTPKSLSAFDEAASNLIRTVKVMAEVKVVKRWPRKKQMPAVNPSKVDVKRGVGEVKIVAIGGSTGAPLVIQTILSLLPKDFPVPVLIVQHMATGFTEGFAQWLRTSTRFPVHLAKHGQEPLPGNAFVAPDGFHMRLERAGYIALTTDDPEEGVRPSVSYLFRSVRRCVGPNAIGVLLSGMGKDGAEELRLMKEEGAVTLVQDKETSVIYGMPGQAVLLEAASHVLSPEMIAAALTNSCRK